MVETVHSLAEFAPYVPVSLPLRAYSAARSAWVTFITDCPLTWWWQQGRRNAQADMEGPVRVVGAPSRQFTDGKAVLATTEEMKRFAPFLLSLTILSPDGTPVPNTKIDWWQADSNGVYAFGSYALRGYFTTDAEGRAEILTVAPGEYGPLNLNRAGHFHLTIDGGSEHELLTTQLYVCPANDKEHMKVDFLNYVRAPRFGNMLQCWSVPSATGGKKYKNFPEIAPDAGQEERIKWWNERLAERSSEELQVAAGAQTTIVLNKKPGWLGF